MPMQAITAMMPRQVDSFERSNIGFGDWRCVSEFLAIESISGRKLDNAPLGEISLGELLVDRRTKLRVAGKAFQRRGEIAVDAVQNDLRFAVPEFVVALILDNRVMLRSLSLSDGQGAVELSGGEWFDHDFRRVQWWLQFQNCLDISKLLLRRKAHHRRWDWWSEPWWRFGFQ